MAELTRQSQSILGREGGRDDQHEVDKGLASSQRRSTVCVEYRHGHQIVELRGIFLLLLLPPRG